MIDLSDHFLLNCHENIQRLLFLCFSLSIITGLINAVILYVLKIRERKLLTFFFVVVCFSGFLYLFTILLCIFPGPYPRVFTNRQMRHEMNIFSGCIFLALTTVSLWLYFILNQEFGKSFMIISSSFLISFLLNSLI